MRKLSHLYNDFRKFEPKSVHGNAADLLIRFNFASLKSSIEVHTDSDEDTQKSSLSPVLSIFGHVTYDLNQRRNVKSKKPAQLPLEGDIKMIRRHAIDVMRKYEADAFHMWDIHSFVELRE